MFLRNPEWWAVVFQSVGIASGIANLIVCIASAVIACRIKPYAGEEKVSLDKQTTPIYLNRKMQTTPKYFNIKEDNLNISQFCRPPSPHLQPPSLIFSPPPSTSRLISVRVPHHQRFEGGDVIPVSTVVFASFNGLFCLLSLFE